MYRPLVILIAIIVGVGCSATALAQSGSRSRGSTDGSVAAAIGEAKKTGRPIFAVSVSDSCPVCQAMLKTLATDETLRPLLQQFVPLEINVDHADFRSWERMFPRKSNGIPGVYVVTSKGKQIFGDEGAMQGEPLTEMLLTSLEKAGRLPDQATLDRIVAATEQAAAHLDAERVEKALAELTPVRDEFLRYGPSLELSEAGKQAMEVAVRIEDLGRLQLQAVVERSADDPVWPAALSIAQMEETYGMLPNLQTEIDAAAKELADSSVNKKLLKQARDLVRAATLAKSGETAKKGAAALRRIIKRYPHTEAAREAALLLERGSGAELAANSSGDDSFRDWTDSSGKYTIRAELLETVGDRVRLKLANGKVVTIAISRLDENARRYLAGQTQ